MAGAKALKFALPSCWKGLRCSTWCLAQEPTEHLCWRVGSACLCLESSWRGSSHCLGQGSGTVRKHPPPRLRPDSFPGPLLPLPPPQRWRLSRPWPQVMLPGSETRQVSQPPPPASTAGGLPSLGPGLPCSRQEGTSLCLPLATPEGLLVL